MSARSMVAGFLLAWIGSTLVLGELRWFRRRPLVERLAPYVPTEVANATRGGVLSVASFRDVIAPLAEETGRLLSRLVGLGDDLGARLERIHSPLDVAAFRVRQLGWAATGFGAGALVALGLEVPTPVTLLFVVGPPLLAFLVVEQQAADAARRWQRRTFLELPVLSEQLAMLLAAGYSLGAALNRLSQRGSGACSADLRLVCGRIRQGLAEIDALREWARRVDVDALDRLVAVLALNREAGDLGRLIAEEARTIRADAQRELVEAIERRAQQVWIPVTVATLLPGVLFMAVPFIQAMRLFAGS
jgi:Flp pilus assembly protein TadB